MADSITPWIAAHINSVATKHGAEFYRSSPLQNKKVQLVQVIKQDSRTDDSPLYAIVSDTSYKMPILFSRDAIATYMKRKDWKPLSDHSKALLVLHQCQLNFQRVPTGKGAGITLEEMLILECKSFAVLRPMDTSRSKNPQPIMKNDKISAYVQGLRKGGGGGNLFMQDKPLDKTSRMLRSPSPISSSPPPYKHSIHKSDWLRSFPKDDTEWLRAMTKAKSSDQSNSESDEPKAKRSSHQRPPADSSSSSEDDQSDVSQPLTNWSSSPVPHRDEEMASDSSSTSSETPPAHPPTRTKRPRRSSPPSSHRPSHSTPVKKRRKTTHSDEDPQEAEPSTVSTPRSSSNPSVKKESQSQSVSKRLPSSSQETTTAPIPSSPEPTAVPIPFSSPYVPLLSLSSSPLREESSFSHHKPRHILKRKVPSPQVATLLRSSQVDCTPRVLVPPSDIATQSQRSELATQSQPKTHSSPRSDPPQPSQSQPQDSLFTQAQSQPIDFESQPAMENGSQTISQMALTSHIHSQRSEISSHSQPESHSQSQSQPLTKHDSLFSQASVDMSQSQNQRTARKTASQSLSQHLVARKSVSSQNHEHGSQSLSQASQSSARKVVSSQRIEISDGSDTEEEDEDEDSDHDSLFSGDGDISGLDGDDEEVAADGDSLTVNLPDTQRDEDLEGPRDQEDEEGDEDEEDEDEDEEREVEVNVGATQEGETQENPDHTAPGDISEDDIEMEDMTNEARKDDTDVISLSDDDLQTQDDLFGNSHSTVGKSAGTPYVLASPRVSTRVAHDQDAWKQPSFMHKRTVTGPEQAQRGNGISGHRHPSAHDDQIDTIDKREEEPDGDSKSKGKMVVGNVRKASKLKGFTVDVREALDSSKVVGWPAYVACLLTFGTGRAQELRGERES